MPHEAMGGFSAAKYPRRKPGGSEASPSTSRSRFWGYTVAVADVAAPQSVAKGGGD